MKVLTYSALVLGGGDCVWDDLERLELMIGMPWPGVVVAANDVGTVWPRVLNHWVSFHPEQFAEWGRQRLENGHPPGYIRWARRGIPEMADSKVNPWGGGSSGLLAVVVAKEMLECRKIVLCGIPMDNRPHFHQREQGRPWRHSDSHWRMWERNLHRMKNVRSMSGRSRDRLGEPTLEWLSA